MPEAVSGPKTTDCHQDHLWDSKTYKSSHGRGRLENQCTTLSQSKAKDIQKGCLEISSVAQTDT